MKFLFTALSISNWFMLPFVLGLSFTEIPVKDWSIIAIMWLVNRVAINFFQARVK